MTAAIFPPLSLPVPTNLAQLFHQSHLSNPFSPSLNPIAMMADNSSDSCPLPSSPSSQSVTYKRYHQPMRKIKKRSSETLVRIISNEMNLCLLTWSTWSNCAYISLQMQTRREAAPFQRRGRCQFD